MSLIDECKASLDRVVTRVLELESKYVSITSGGPLPQIRIVIDTHENKLIAIMGALPFVVQRTIQPADIYIEVDGKEEYMYERKTHSDLLGSLRPPKGAQMSRWKSQTKRIKEHPLPSCRKSYLLESSTRMRANFEKLSTLRGCESNKVHRDGLPWRRSMCTMDTAILIVRDMLSIMEYGRVAGHGLLSGASAPAMNHSREDLQRISAAGVGSVRKDFSPSSYLTNDATYLGMLSSCRGIRGPCALAISKLYPSMAQLIHAYDACPDFKARTRMLQDVRFFPTLNSKTKRRVGPAISNRLASVLYPEKSGDLPGAQPTELSDVPPTTLKRQRAPEADKPRKKQRTKAPKKSKEPTLKQKLASFNRITEKYAVGLIP